jgi:FtsZ-binding cell division protein ZapB
MLEIAIASLNTLPYPAVSPILNQILGELQSLQSEVQELRENNQDLEDEIAELKKNQELHADNQLIQLRLINGLREEVRRDPGPTTTELERLKRIEDLCVNAPGHIISLAELRGRLGIDKAVLSRLLKKIDRDKFYLKKSSMDKRLRYLCLRPKIS